MGIRSLGWDLVTDATTFNGYQEVAPIARRQNTKQSKQIATKEDFDNNECDCLICHRPKLQGVKI